MEEQPVEPNRRRRRISGSPALPVPLPAVIGVAVIAIAVVVGLVYLGQRLQDRPPAIIGSVPAGETGVSSGSGTAVPRATPTPLPPQGAIVYDGHTKGAASAPVEIVEFADFQCPICGAHAKQVGPFIDDAYVSRGLARVTFKYFPFIGQESLWAALGSECANEQDKFWPFHDKVFANQSGENQGVFAKDRLKAFARDLSLNAEQFNTCLDSNKYQETVRQQFNEGINLGVQATPTFFVNGQKFEGLQQFSVFQRTIESELTKRR